LPPNPALGFVVELVVFVVVVVVVVSKAGALFHPPKSSSAAIVVSDGLVFLLLECHPLSSASGFMVDDAVTGAGSGAPQTFDEPQASKPETAGAEG
jgi:hypothetical protein